MAGGAGEKINGIIIGIAAYLDEATPPEAIVGLVREAYSIEDGLRGRDAVAAWDADCEDPSVAAGDDEALLRANGDDSCGWPSSAFNAISRRASTRTVWARSARTTLSGRR